MPTIVRSALLVATALACTALAAPADAASNRTFVSGLGNDANPCTLTAPCRTLQAAFNATANNGSIEVLDPTGYGALTITHSISIEGHGWAALNGIGTAASTITIAAGGADHVTLRGLVVDGFGFGPGVTIIPGTGVTITSAGIVSIEDTFIRNFIDGVSFRPSSSATLAIVNSVISDNSGDGLSVFTPNNPPPMFVDLSGVSFISNDTGLDTVGTTVAVKNCIFVGQTHDGIDILGGLVRISDSMIANNGGAGVNQLIRGSATLDRTQFVGNGSDWSGNVTSYGNNVMDQAGPPLTSLK